MGNSGIFQSMLTSMSNMLSENGDYIDTFAQDLIFIIQMVFIGIGALVLPFAIYLGFQMAYAADEGKRRETKKRLMNVLVSLLIIILLQGLLATISIFVGPSFNPGEDPHNRINLGGNWGHAANHTNPNNVLSGVVLLEPGREVAIPIMRGSVPLNNLTEPRFIAIAEFLDDSAATALWANHPAIASHGWGGTVEELFNNVHHSTPGSRNIIQGGRSLANPFPLNPRISIRIPSDAPIDANLPATTPANRGTIRIRVWGPHTDESHPNFTDTEVPIFEAHVRFRVVPPGTIGGGEGENVIDPEGLANLSHVEFFARLIFREMSMAGNPQYAVATVVLNRARNLGGLTSANIGSRIRQVISAPGQFEPYPTRMLIPPPAQDAGWLAALRTATTFMEFDGSAQISLSTQALGANWRDFTNFVSESIAFNPWLIEWIALGRPTTDPGNIGNMWGVRYWRFPVMDWASRRSYGSNTVGIGRNVFYRTGGTGPPTNISFSNINLRHPGSNGEPHFWVDPARGMPPGLRWENGQNTGNERLYRNNVLFWTRATGLNVGGGGAFPMISFDNG